MEIFIDVIAEKYLRHLWLEKILLGLKFWCPPLNSWKNSTAYLTVTTTADMVDVIIPFTELTNQNTIIRSNDTRIQ